MKEFIEKYGAILLILIVFILIGSTLKEIKEELQSIKVEVHNIKTGIKNE